MIGDPGTDLGVFAGGTERSWGFAINDSGQVTGYASNPVDGAELSFRTSPNGLISDPGTSLGGTANKGLAINSSGQVAGNNGHAYRTTAHGLITDPGTDFGSYGGTYSYAFGINDLGQVTGFATFPNGNFHAYRTSPTGMISDPGTDLGTLGGQFSEGFAINASGQVTGDSHTANGENHAFRTTATGLVSDPGTDLGPGTGYSINRYGVVVGTSGFGAFLYDTQMRDLNSLIAPGSSWVLDIAQGINDSGWIVGEGTFNGDSSRAFLLIPVPEPTSLAFTAAALLGGWVARRRRNRF
jgi:probable HAF family extracellular repeat protein